MTEPNDSWSVELASLVVRRMRTGGWRKRLTSWSKARWPLTDAELLYRQGMELANRCQLLLTEAELRISQVGTERGVTGASAGGDFRSDDDRPSQNDLPPQDEWDMPPPPEPDDPSLFEDDQAPF